MCRGGCARTSRWNVPAMTFMCFLTTEKWTRTQYAWVGMNACVVVNRFIFLPMAEGAKIGSREHRRRVLLFARSGCTIILLFTPCYKLCFRSSGCLGTPSMVYTSWNILVVAVRTPARGGAVEDCATLLPLRDEGLVAGG